LKLLRKGKYQTLNMEMIHKITQNELMVTKLSQLIQITRKEMKRVTVLA